ncbi:hypothetical protein BCR36DRAFT_583188 [Piromyces finnis]|uniref:Uncharacterized protein n=1 Tax=Piromyces finnis TaxID=1754191 RepID=A0A1Y1VB90_9FUNG|nr:hypothetical protein BCR36DRAFT_583188 [Piromyces finnis]|eukprot:ORX51141.1 hypothetical protein BCR36DRAFT_583188 [Piromyces finnis]
MGFSIRKNRTSFIPRGNSYHKLRSIEDMSSLINKRYSSTSIPMPESLYNKRFSEQSFNTVSNVSIADTIYSNVSNESTDSGNFNDISAYYNQYEYVEAPKKKKHRKRKALSKIIQSFSINDPLQQSLQSPDFGYYYNQVNGSNYNFNYFPY